MKKLAIFLLSASFAFGQSHPLENLIQTARSGPSAAGLADLVAKTLSAHGGVAVWGEDYLFVSDLTLAPKNEPVNPSTAGVSIDMQAPLSMEKIPGSSLWMRLVKMRTGVTHAYPVLCRWQSGRKSN